MDDDPTFDAGGEEGTSERISIDERRDEKRWQEEMDRARERGQSMHRRKKELQARHRETWAAVKRAVDSADPEDLREMGCPDDEYDDVVVYLTGAVLRNEEVTRQALITWFMNRYGSAASTDAVVDLLVAVAAIQVRISANS